MKVSSGAASACAINTDYKNSRPGDMNKLVDNLIEVKQGVSKMILSFNDPTLSNQQKTVLVEQSKPLLARMSDDLALIDRHKGQSTQGSNLYSDFRGRQLESLAKKVNADYVELKDTSNNYEKNSVRFSSDTKVEDGGRSWNDKGRAWE